MKRAVLSLSGGMDSSTVLLHLLANGYKVTALSFDYGQKHNVELERAQQLVDYLNNKGQKTKNPYIKHDITYQVIKLDSYFYAKENNEEVVLPQDTYDGDLPF